MAKWLNWEYFQPDITNYAITVHYITNWQFTQTPSNTELMLKIPHLKKINE